MMFRFAYSDPILVPYRNIVQSNYDGNELYFAFVTRHPLTSQYSSSGVIES